VLTYGIPEFRLPKAIVRREIDAIREMGAEIVTDFVVGRTARWPSCRTTTTPCSWPPAPACRGSSKSGRDLIGVMSANEYLTRELLRAYEIARTRRCRRSAGGVVGPATSRGRCRTAKRSALARSRCSTAAPRPRRRPHEELEHAEEEGIVFEYLAAPIEYLGNGGGFLTGLRCQRMELGEPDSSGRPRPCRSRAASRGRRRSGDFWPSARAEHLIKETPLSRDQPARHVGIDPETMRTNLPRVYAAGMWSPARPPSSCDGRRPHRGGGDP